MIVDRMNRSRIVSNRAREIGTVTIDVDLSCRSSSKGGRSDEGGDPRYSWKYEE